MVTPIFVRELLSKKSVDATNGIIPTLQQFPNFGKVYATYGGVFVFQKGFQMKEAFYCVNGSLTE